MVLVILMGVVDVCYVFYQRLIAPPFLLLSVSDLFKAFGAFMVVLIAIEIFINIRLYAIAAVVLALGVAYWLVGKTSRLLTEAGEAGDDVKALVPDD
jgi:uncharacterized membrane protein (DUF373 family)